MISLDSRSRPLKHSFKAFRQYFKSPVLRQLASSTKITPWQGLALRCCIMSSRNLAPLPPPSGTPGVSVATTFMNDSPLPQALRYLTLHGPLEMTTSEHDWLDALTQSPFPSSISSSLVVAARRRMIPLIVLDFPTPLGPKTVTTLTIVADMAREWRNLVHLSTARLNQRAHVCIDSKLSSPWQLSVFQLRFVQLQLQPPIQPPMLSLSSSSSSLLRNNSFKMSFASSLSTYPMPELVNVFGKSLSTTSSIKQQNKLSSWSLAFP